MYCIRLNNFNLNEKHICFQCNTYFIPKYRKTCKICNWKVCINNHCGCTLSKDTKIILNNFYNLFCKLNNYSKETINALKIMLNTFKKNCLKCLI